jgi:hypothetical protein
MRSVRHQLRIRLDLERESIYGVRPSPSGLAIPIVEAGAPTLDHFERRALVEAAFCQVFPESGYSQISGASIVLMERYFKGASDVLMICADTRVRQG